jgi:hypothetical protein
MKSRQQISREKAQETQNGISGFVPFALVRGQPGKTIQ